MTLDAAVASLVVLGVIGLLVTDRVPAAAAVLGGVVVLLVLEVIPPELALAGFSNPAPFAVAALYVVARGVEKTGVIQPLLHQTLSQAKSPRGALVRLVVPIAVASSVLNNTPIVAAVAPQVELWARRAGVAPSRFLLPLSYAAILGGTVTAIGTSTTLVVSGLLEAHGYEPFSLLEVAVVGLPVALVGLLYVVIAAPRLLPDRGQPFHNLGEARDFTVFMEVVPGGRVAERTVQEAGLRDLRGVFLAGVMSEDGQLVTATPSTRLRGRDLLVFVGRSSEVLDLTSNPGLRSAEEAHARTLYQAGHTYFEVVVGPDSRLVGETLKTAEFRGSFQAAVLAIHRSGEAIEGKLGQVRLRPGDTLLLLADEGFATRWRDRSEFLLISHLGGLAPASRSQGFVVGAILLAMLTLGAAGLLSLLQIALLGALLLVVTRVLTPGEARRAVDLNVILLIAGAFGLGNALESTGVAAALGDLVLAAVSPFGSLGAIAGLILLTLILTEFITNNAAAVLIFPFVVAVAESQGLPLRATAIIVAITASASFLTPLGYQTNTMVYGPGGYRTTDYLRFGAPLTVLVFGVLMFLSRTILGLG